MASRKQTLRDLVHTTRPGYHPVIEMLNLIDVMELDEDGSTLVHTHNPQQRFAMHSKVAEYLEPKLSAVKVEGQVDSKVEVSITVEG